MELRADIMVDISDEAKDGIYRRVEVLTGPGRRRNWSSEAKARVVEETLQPVVVVADVARRLLVSSQQVFTWRREMRLAAGAPLSFVPIVPEIGHSTASITRALLRAEPGTRPAQRRQSSTARASKRGKKSACIDPSGYDTGKKIKGRKRYILVDTRGLLMQAIVHSANIQDRNGDVLLMGALFRLYPFLLKLYADSG